MNIEIIPPEKELPVERAHVISTVIKSFKGRRDVEVHLFRYGFDESEMDGYDWLELIEDSHHPEAPNDPLPTRRVLLESFTAEERDQVIEYLKTRYKDRLESITACPLTFPLPMGLPPLSGFPEGKTIGFIRFDMIPNYSLPFAFRGLYDLAQHEPIVNE